MKPQERIVADLEATIADARGERGARELAEMVCRKDQGPLWLLGLQHNCTRAVFRVRTTIEARPVTSDGFPESESIADPTHIYDRHDVLKWIETQEWDWLHPRFQWLRVE